MSEAPSPREAIVAKIQKLRQFTIANGATEAEATSAMAKIAELMATYNISQTEADVRREASACGRTFFQAMGEQNADWTFLQKPIQHATSTRAWQSYELEDLLGLGFPQGQIKVHFFGTPADIEAAYSLLSLLYTSMNVETAKFLQAVGPKSSHRAKSFRLGMLERFIERLKELEPKPQLSTGTGLMVLKDQLVHEEFAKLGLSLKKRGGMKATPIDPNAFQAGKSAASRVDLGQTPKLHPAGSRPNPTGTKALR